MIHLQLIFGRIGIFEIKLTHHEVNGGDQGTNLRPG